MTALVIILTVVVGLIVLKSIFKWIMGPSMFREDGVKVTCIGIRGRIVGHLFQYPGFDILVPSRECIRCGMPRGGWKS